MYIIGMVFTNGQIVKKLRDIAAAYSIKKANLFQIRAYETAADAIEHSTTEVYDLWKENNLDQIPGLGPNLKSHLEELFKTGKVKHWEEIKKDFPDGFYEFLDIPGVGPKTAQELSRLGVKNTEDLARKIKHGQLVEKGFSAKIAEKIMDGIREMESLKSGRMLLSYAYAQAEKVLTYLKISPDIKTADVLGSLRRMVATVGDLDFSVSSENPQKAVEYIKSMPGVSQVVDEGESKITVVLSSGVHLDFLISNPDSYGALLQHFTGSKHHNIHLRTLAEKEGLSLSEYGVKNINTGKIHPTRTEDELYQVLKMQTPPPEIREDTGEIEAALEHKLPKLIESSDIKGDLHIHSNFPLEPSHGPGADSIEDLAQEAVRLGYSYLGLADHPPSFTNHSHQRVITLLKDRLKDIDKIRYSSNKVALLNLLEVDILPDGSLSVPEEGLKMLDFVIAGVHSSHRQSKEEMTKRILKALESPYVKVLTHPTGRVLNERQSYDADWETIFKYAAANEKAMEINAFPNRLDLPDALIRQAKNLGVKFVINTDTHQLPQMELMSFGVAMARRGWLTKEDVINTRDWTRFAKWFNINS